jgi:hypothetical protein
MPSTWPSGSGNRSRARTAQLGCPVRGGGAAPAGSRSARGAMGVGGPGPPPGRRGPARPDGADVLDDRCVSTRGGAVVAPPRAGSARPIGVRARVATFAGSTTATKVRTRRPCELRHDVEYSTIIHRADAAATAGVAYQLDAELAAEAITDHLAMMTSPGWAAQRPDSAEALRRQRADLALARQRRAESRRGRRVVRRTRR